MTSDPFQNATPSKSAGPDLCSIKFALANRISLRKPENFTEKELNFNINRPLMTYHDFTFNCKINFHGVKTLTVSSFKYFSKINVSASLRAFN